jgi:hypothetical protein
MLNGKLTLHSKLLLQAKEMITGTSKCKTMTIRNDTICTWKRDRRQDMS